MQTALGVDRSAATTVHDRRSGNLKVPQDSLAAVASSWSASLRHHASREADSPKRYENRWRDVSKPGATYAMYHSRRAQTPRHQPPGIEVVGSISFVL